MRFLFWIVAKLFRLALWLIVIAVAIPVLGLGYGFAVTGSTKVVEPSPKSESGADAVRAAQSADSGKYLRPEDNTFLTYPEWSIVYAARDYADFLRENRESGFPYFTYAVRYWEDYARALRATRDYPFNTEYNVMLAVIGTSQTVEYLLQGAWENTVGRLTEFIAWDRVGEDDVRAALAHDYAQMLDQKPWYEFPYSAGRHLTWRIPPAEGAAAVRSWERKIVFGASDSVKQVYARAIKASIAAGPGQDETDIAVWAKGPVAQAIALEPAATLLGEFGDDGAVFVAKRYQAFTELAERLANRGVGFVEIGGNRQILATVLGPRAIDHPLASITVHFSQEIPARPGVWRTALLVPVSNLHELFAPLEDNGFELEHLYDY